jgi:hypothetical protein
MPLNAQNATDDEVVAYNIGKRDGFASKAETEQLALEYVELTGELAAAVEWCVEHSGETLDDNPRALTYAKRVLAKALAKRSTADAN